MFRIEWTELISLSGHPELTNKYLTDIDKCLRANYYELIQLSDCFVVTEMPEIDLLRGIPTRLLKKYLPDDDDKSIENEYANEMEHEFGFGYGDKCNYDNNDDT